MKNQETDKIFHDYNSGEKTIEETNQALKDSGAGYHLEHLTDEERVAKNERENIAGYVENPNARPALPQEVDKRRRTDLIGKSEDDRKIIQHTAHGKFRVEYNEQGYFLRSSRVDDDPE